jgi:hypothetical protein
MNFIMEHGIRALDRLDEDLLNAIGTSVRKGSLGRHLLPRFKTVNDQRFQLHATKGWRKV